jgi:aspartyl-tRNA(Asn)/glutamyl-tRNA(Gln) amidotransferase subunit B
VRHDAAPNVATCPVCLAHPGTLPVLNGGAVALAVRAALALGCEVHAESRFARKHYFYPDLPKGYQISQYDRPLATGGALHVGETRYRLTRVHIEEDAGKMLHAPGGSTIDWNRAGVPLIEIVGEPELRSPEAAEAWMRTLHRVLVEAGVCPGDLEKGHLRCDANVSVHRTGEPWGTRVEVKNINSFRFVRNALRFEIDRQVALLEAGGRVERETRTWAEGRTVTLRKKEGDADYRYFPEPDLPPLVIPAQALAAARASLPGTPLDLHLAARDAARAEEWMDRYGLGAYEVGVLQAHPEAARFFEAAVALGGDARQMCNWVQVEVLRRLHEGGLGRLEAGHLVGVQRLLDAGAVTRDQARRVIDRIAADGGDPEEVARREGFRVVGDADTLRTLISTLLKRHPAEYAKWRAGNKGMLGFFMGQVMAETHRRADPRRTQELLQEALQAEAPTSREP